MKTLETKEDIAFMVDEFYKKARQHEVLGPIFNNAIGELWFLHLDTLNRFWETLLLDGQSYFGRPFPKHLNLPIKDEHFDMWLMLFNQNIDEHFVGEKAQEAKKRAGYLAQSFRSKLAQFIRP